MSTGTAYPMTQHLNRLFTELTELLRAYQPYWRSAAYYTEHLPWKEKHPDLVRELMALPHERVASLARNGEDLTEFLTPFLPFAQALASAVNIDVLPQEPTKTVSPHFYVGMPGRKWQQVEAFARCVPATAPILEWCGGKSHLGFYLQHCGGQAVTSLEWDRQLVAEANTRATKNAVPLQSHQVDVLSGAEEPYVQAAEQVVALHACGELHEHLLRLSVKHSVAQVHIAPCCYHKRIDEQYQPLSMQGKQADLALNKQELHTAVMETMTAGAGAQRQRQQLQMMRLGFDELQRDLRNAAEYLPLASLPARWAREDFASFCRHCAALKHLSLPTVVDWVDYQKRGEQRFWRVAALDLVRFLFRRPIEIWLALDRALLLQEHGYQVRVGTFCPVHVTPRNLLIQAWRNESLS